MSENNQNYLTEAMFKEGLAEFTEEVLLPAVERIVDDRLEEKLEAKFNEKLDPVKASLNSLARDFQQKLDPINASLNSLKLEIEDIKATLERIDKRTDEDATAAFEEIEKLKKRISSVEEQMKIMQTQKA